MIVRESDGAAAFQRMKELPIIFFDSLSETLLTININNENEESDVGNL